MTAAIVAGAVFVALLPLGVSLIVAIGEPRQQPAQHCRQGLGRVGHGR